MEQSTSLGFIERIKINLTEPITMNFDMEFNKLVILVGANGTGKSLLMKIAYCCNELLSSIIVLDKNGLPFDKDLFQQTAQYVFDGCFTDQNFHGTITAHYKHAHIALAFDKGKVTNLEYDVLGDIKHPTHILYMSSDFRTFESITKYLKIKKMVMKDLDTKSKFDPKVPIALNKEYGYKLYDISFVERLTGKLPYGVSEHLSKTLVDNYEFTDEIIIFDYNTETCEFFYITKDERTVKLSSLSKGHQSLLNMFFATSIFS